MLGKDKLLGELRSAIDEGLVTRQEIERILGGQKSAARQDKGGSKRVSVVQSLFYVSGIILFAAILSVIAQTWEGGVLLHLMLTVLLGGTIWAVAFMLDRYGSSSDIRQGLGDALLLTGSLLMITGGYIIINSFGSYGSVDFFEAAPALLALAFVHTAFYYVLRRDLLYLMAIFLGVASIGSLLFGILRDADASGNAWAFVFIAVLGLLSWTTHTVSQLTKSTVRMQESLDRPVIILVLVTAYIASFGNLAGLWYLALAIGICGVYYLSILKRQKILLGTASTFLVLMTITIAFRYFADFGLTVSLVISAMGILSVAALASQLSKKYLV